ncbi:hypothetical protein ACIF8T_37980 [Streptomyces sp. NPDC085946]|uniref:hypothetical protein n=1 Tax=Streptomyces sp. NPDC085946 TaxID=3365744 RepID=UPI0037D63BF1
MGRGCTGLVAALAAVVVAVTGCGRAQEPQRTPAPSSSAAAPRPLTDAEHLRISDARQVLMERCMRRQGFKFWPAQRLSLEESRTLGYATEDVTWARKHGYGSRIRTEEDRARRTNPNLAYRRTLSSERRSAYDAALDGGLEAPMVSAELPGGGKVRKRIGGCAAEAERVLYGDPGAWFRLDKTTAGLRPMYVPRVMGDKRFTEALASWARCMARAGHPYADPQEARSAALARAAGSGTDEAFTVEREIAVSDAVCTRTSSLRTVGRQLEAHYLGELRDEYGKALDDHARVQREALRRAERLAAPRT